MLLPLEQWQSFLPGVILGNITFSGSLIAWGKLSGKVKDFAFKGQHIVNMILFGAAIALSDIHYFRLAGQ